MNNWRFESLVESIRLMDTLSEGLVLLDDELRVLSVNRSGAIHLQLLAQAEIGDQLSHLGGQSIQTLLAPLPPGPSHSDIVIEQPTPRVFEVIIYSIQGGAAWLLVLLDRTEVRQLQLLAQQQDRLAVVGQLAAGIAHDFNNLLTPILLYTDLVVSHLSPASEEWSHLQQVIRSTRRAKELILQILTFSQPEAQPRGTIFIQAILDEVLKLLRGVLPATIEIHQYVDRRVGPVLAEPTQIHQILMNLCINAYQAMVGQGGVLTVSLDAVEIEAGDLGKYPQMKEGRYVRLTVSDTGHGLDQVTRQRIFEPFFTTKPVGQGTGMGLSVVYGIVRNHAGAITVDSEPGQGTTFHIYLPQVDAHVKIEESAEQPMLRGSEHILVVDDEQAIAFAVQETLENLGYSVTASTNSMEALAIFRAAPESFDLVITDLTMPRLTGTELMTELLHIRPDLPILLITGTGETPTPDFVKATGALADLLKPFSASDLSRTIRRILDKS